MVRTIKVIIEIKNTNIKNIPLQVVIYFVFSFMLKYFSAASNCFL